MLSVLVISTEGEGYEVAYRLALEGNVVRFYCKDEKTKYLGRGIRNPQRVDKWESYVDGSDLILFTTTGNGRAADSLAKRGKVVLGCNRFADMIELDRGFGAQVARLMQIDVPDSWECKNADEVLAVLEKVDFPCILKPYNNKSVTLTLKSRTADNAYLKSVVKVRPEVFKGGCLVQRVVDGVEISTEGWFDGRRWTKPFNHTIEVKRYGEGDKGLQTGCMGNVVWTTSGDELTRRMHERLTAFLQKVGYVGPLDVNAIVTKDRIYFLEFTPRFGYDAIQTYTELLNLPLGEVLFRIATGTIKSVPVKQGVALGVRMVIGPYPNPIDCSYMRGIKVLNYIPEAAKHVWLADVMWENDEPVLAGVDGQIGCVTAWGVSLTEAKRRVYRTLDNLILTEDVMYRRDVGDSALHNVRAQWNQLAEWGYIQPVKEVEYAPQKGKEQEGNSVQHTRVDGQLSTKGNDRKYETQKQGTRTEDSSSYSLAESRKEE